MRDALQYKNDLGSRFAVYSEILCVGRFTMTEGDRQNQTTQTLPPALRTPDAERLHSSIKAAEGQSLWLDGSNVTMIGAQCLQVLLAARALWAANNLEFGIVNLSEEMHAALSILGVSPDQIGFREGNHDA